MSAMRLRIGVALAIVYVVWGSTYLAIKVAVDTIPPLLVAGTRFLAAALVLGAILAASSRSLRVPRREALSAGGLGVWLLGFGVGCVHVAETRIDSTVAAMIAGSVPLQVVAWRLLAGSRVSRSTMAAAAIGLGGLALVVVPVGASGGSTVVGLAVMLGASVAWSTGSFASGGMRLPRDAFVSTTYQMLGGGIALLAAATVAGEWGELGRASVSAAGLSAWLYLVLAGSVVGFTAYAWLLRNAPISQVVTHQFVNPLVALALGAAILGERLPATAFAGAAIVVGAVFVTARSEGGAAVPAEPETGPVRSAEAVAAAARR
jgi:drug/metabolite transporter (DMT)-like permease